MIKIISEPFGTTRAGIPVKKWTMTNSSGMSVGIISYGCTVQSILVADRCGVLRDVVLGYDDVSGYENGTCYYGAFVGRYANRIKGAAFDLNGKHYTLEKNNGSNHLHGPFTHRVFEGTVTDDTLIFRGVSAPEEEGYPGTLTFEVHYTLREDNALVIEYLASTDEDTVINFTNHSYFNLDGSRDILHHTLRIKSSSFTEGNEETVPTGTILPVENTPMDFREEKEIGRDISADYEQLKWCRGYDHNYILDTDSLSETFAEAFSDQSGIVLRANTTQPAVQLYTGNYIDDDIPAGKNGVRYARHAGFALETQHYPCSPNFPHFPDTVLHPGETYRQTTVYSFDVR